MTHNDEHQVSFQVSRHDDHNVEVKLSLESRKHDLNGRAEIFLFLPTNVKMGACAKDDLAHDFNSRVRLALPESKKEAASLRYAAQDCRALVEQISLLAKDELIERVQRLGALIDEILKANRAQHRKELFQIHSLVQAPPDPSAPMVRLASEIRDTAERVREVHAVARQESARAVPYFGMLAEFVSHSYAQYLGELSGVFDQILEKKQRYCETIYSRGWMVLGTALASLRSEAVSLMEMGGKEMREDETKRELHLLRIGQLKKFFHSNLFVEVTKNQINRKFKEPAAATAAAVAAIWATYFQHFQAPQLSSVGYSGISVLSLGVAAYVLKDRMKEASRNFLADKALRFLPDVEQELLTHEKPIGRVREWLSKSKKVPASILELRKRFQFSEAEGHLHEDVLHLAKQYSVKAKDVEAEHWALQDSLRINLERYLKHLDDPYKEMTFFEDDGQVTRLKAHRVYFFYLVVSTQGGESAVFRIVLDKQGVQRVERMDEVAV